MKIERKKLIEILELVRPGLANKDIILQSTSFIFTEEGITTFNDEISIFMPFESDIYGAVKANEFYNLLSKIKDDEIEITTTEAELIIKSKKKKAGIRLEPEILLPIDEVDRNLNLRDQIDLPSDFLKSIEIASHCAAEDMSKPYLTCVHINGDAIEASDTFRIIQVMMESELDEDPFLLPATAVKSLIKYPVNKVSLAPGWVNFTTDDGLVFSCRVFGGEYPNIDQFLKVEGQSLIFPDDTLTILDEAGIFTKKNQSDEYVNIIVENKKMTIRGEGDHGWYQGELNCRYGGDKIEFMVDPSFLQDILKNLKNCIVGDQVILFQGDNFDYTFRLLA